MADWLLHGALPVGMLLFVSTVYGFLRKKAGFVRAARAFPGLARELGLTYEQPRYDKQVGRLTGRVSGFEVLVDPDDQRCLRVGFDVDPLVDLRTYDRQRAAPPKMRVLYSGSKPFDRWFKTRFAGEEVAERFHDTPNLERMIEPFTGSLSRHISSVSVTGQGVTVNFDYGSPPYIAPEAVRQLLPACVRLARVVCENDQPLDRD